MTSDLLVIKTKVEAIMLAEIWVNLRASNDGLNRLLEKVIPELKKSTNRTEESQYKRTVHEILSITQNYHKQSKLLPDISHQEYASFNEIQQRYEKLLVEEKKYETLSSEMVGLFQNLVTELLQSIVFYLNDFVKLNNILESRAPDSPEYNPDDPLEKIYKKLNQSLCQTSRFVEKLKDDNQNCKINAIWHNIKSYFVEAKELHNKLREKYIEKIGFPIAFAKNTIQAEYIINFLNKLIEEGREQEFIEGIINENKIFNFVSKPENLEKIPKLQSASDQEFWGNENPSVSSMLLSIIANMYGIYDHKLAIGAGHFHPFFDSKFKLHDSLHTTFTDQRGQMCFGIYQFGGGRYAKNPNQDCSSAVGKALDIGEKVLSFNTRELHTSYDDPDNKYNLVRVTSNKNGEIFNYELLQKGDIYLRGNHCSVIVNIEKVKLEGLEYQETDAKEPSDDYGCFIKTWQFNRDIDSWLNVQKGLKEPNDNLRPREGAGECYINLSGQIKAGIEVCILRKPNQELGREYAIDEVIKIIDDNYDKTYPDQYDTALEDFNPKSFLMGMNEFNESNLEMAA